MKPKNWTIPIFFFCACIICLFTYQNKQNSNTQQALLRSNSVPSHVWSINASDITQITYSSKSETIDTIKTENGWTLPDFDNRPADSKYIYNIMSYFLNPTFDLQIPVNPEDLYIYGIDSSSPTISVHTSKGDILEVIGGDSFNNSSNYVYIPLTNTISTMPSTLFSTLTTTHYTWLSKNLLDFDLDNVSSVALNYKGHSATLVPTATASGIIFDSNQFNKHLANEFMSFLDGLRVDGFVTSDTDSNILNAYGFNSPILDCTITLNSGEIISFKIGDINEAQDICYAKIQGTSEIVTIPYFSLSEFNILYSEFKKENKNNTIG